MRYALLSSLLVVACGGPTPPPTTGDVATIAPPSPAAQETPLAYPETRKQDVVDDYHGVKVADPYRWLEDDNAADTKAWVEAQNKVTFDFLGSIADRESLSERLTKLWDYEKYGVPHKRANRYFFSKNDGLQNQSVLYWTESLSAEPKVLLDPNTLSEDGTVALAGYSISEDGKYMAYGLAAAGSDWNEWRVRDVATGKDTGDHLKWIKFSGATWSHDGKGFYYGRYPAPKEGEKLSGANFNQKLYYHRLGQKQEEDALVYERPDHPKWGFGSEITDDGRYLVVSVWKGTGPKNLVFYKDLKSRKKNAKFVELISTFEADYRLIDNNGSTLWFVTDLDAPRSRVIAINLKKPAVKNWKEIIGESKDTLSGVSAVGDRFFASYLSDAKSKIKIYDLEGKDLGEVALPGIGSASGFGGRRNHKETFYYFTSFNTAGSVYRYDIAANKSEIFRNAEVDFDSDQYVTKQVFFASKDGTKIPMFISHKKGLELDGSNPTNLYGYGGFNISLTPSFSVTNLVWMERGGVLAIPGLRGGGEYGREWHMAGTKLRKQNVFDDFIAAAEWLIANKYTSPAKLAISGGSNGGLLVGAAMTQRPELFGAAIPKVGVMDMLRFHKFTIGWAWIDDYGSSDDADEFKALYAYSPLHNLKKGTRYPSTLVTTADHDDRVVPAHSFKFAAALQATHEGDNPVLIRVQTKAGHGAGKPTKMLIAESADVLAFLTKVLGSANP